MRELRRGRGLTLKALGREAGLSHPFLSQLERGLARPSVGSVERIAQALEVPVSSLWTRPSLETAIVVRRPEDAADGVREILGGHGTLRVREWSGGAKTWSEEAETTTGEVCVYVIRGVLEVDLGGTVHALSEGDSVLFDGSVPHRLRRRGGTSTRALYVATG